VARHDIAAGRGLQGHVDVMMDNLIAEQKARPMIIVMDNLNDASRSSRRACFDERA
jgi:enterochelin esterase-like enzyme